MTFVLDYLSPWKILPSVLRLASTRRPCDKRGTPLVCLSIGFFSYGHSYLSFVPTDEVPHSPTVTLEKHIEEGCRREESVRSILFLSRLFLHRFLSAPWRRDTASTLTSRIPCVSRTTFSPRSEVVWTLSYVYQAYLRLLHTDMSVPLRLTGYGTFYCSSNLYSKERKSGTW